MFVSNRHHQKKTLQVRYTMDFKERKTKYGTHY